MRHEGYENNNITEIKGINSCENYHVTGYDRTNKHTYGSVFFKGIWNKLDTERPPEIWNTSSKEDTDSRVEMEQVIQQEWTGNHGTIMDQDPWQQHRNRTMNDFCGDHSSI